MAAFAYLMLPVTGLIAYLSGRDRRTRFHGLQAIFLGLLWPVALYASGLGPPALVQAVFGFGALLWLSFLILTLAGRDPTFPGVGSLLAELAEPSVRDEPRSTSGNSRQSSH